ncbi:hypothetical protein D6850_18160 [Roseovarius spongiae]|uniref:Uncharacterized protein n=1 Tax=Roseovarius spongiae TaxID=2320272 RepID=A0A3A8AQY8_9RHOB|nr:hypothetical protein [Roseovarius spongiae]RKF12396.1 hypothetical protein D6850_18160 [Roseovarius spongiae]
MKKILLHDSNTDRIDEVLRQVNGRATAHTITSMTEVARIAMDAEAELLRRGASRTSLKGAVIIHRPAGPGKTYAKTGRRVITTCVTLERGAAHWGLVEVERDEIRADSPEICCIRLPAAATQKIAKAAFSGLSFQDRDGRPIDDLLGRALMLARLPCASMHERFALLKALTDGSGHDPAAM